MIDGQVRAQATLPDIRVPAAWTLAGLVLGLVAGMALARLPGRDDMLAIVDPVGALWLRALKMTILPLVVSLLFIGIVRTMAVARAGAMARRALAAFASLLLAGALLAALFVPLILQAVPIPAAARAVLGANSVAPAQVPGLAGFITGIVPGNVFAAAADDAVLPLIVFFAFFAMAAAHLHEDLRDQLAGLFQAVASAMMIVIGWVLAVAPVGVFALALRVAADSGAAAITALLHYIATVSSIGVLVMLGAYGLAKVLARQRLRTFARAALPAQMVAISTQSSLASLPAMLAACRELGVRETSADFVLPLAVALFRATSPAMNVAVAIYVASLTGVELTPVALAAGVATAMLTTLGAPSLPGTISFVTSIGPVALAMGVPVGPLALLVAVEMLPDIFRTVGNVTMDVAVTAAIDRRDRS